MQAISGAMAQKGEVDRQGSLCEIATDSVWLSKQPRMWSSYSWCREGVNGEMRA